MQHEPARSYQVRKILRRFHVHSASEAVVTLALLVSYPLLLVVATLPTDTDDRRGKAARPRCVLIDGIAQCPDCGQRPEQ